MLQPLVDACNVDDAIPAAGLHPVWVRHSHLIRHSSFTLNRSLVAQTHRSSRTSRALQQVAAFPHCLFLHFASLSSKTRVLLLLYSSPRQRYALCRLLAAFHGEAACEESLQGWHFLKTMTHECGQGAQRMAHSSTGHRLCALLLRRSEQRARAMARSTMGRESTTLIFSQSERAAAECARRDGPPQTTVRC